MGKRRNRAPHREQHRVSLLSIPADTSRNLLYRTQDRILPPAQSGIDRASRPASRGSRKLVTRRVGMRRSEALVAAIATLCMSTPTEERPGLALSWQAVLYTHRLPTFLPRQYRRRGGSGLPFSYSWVRVRVRVIVVRVLFLGDRRKEIGD